MRSSPKSSNFARAFVTTLVIAGIGTFFFGLWIAQGVRRTAAETDRRLRTLAWAALAYADAQGAFPLSNEELIAFGPGGEALAQAGAWPSSRAEALEGAPPSDLAESLRAIVTAWSPDRVLPPQLRPDGLPTSVGTTPLVQGWLDAKSESLGKQARDAAP